MVGTGKDLDIAQIRSWDGFGIGAFFLMSLPHLFLFYILQIYPTPHLVHVLFFSSCVMYITMLLHKRNKTTVMNVGSFEPLVNREFIDILRSILAMNSSNW